MPKDIFIDNTIAKNFSNPLDPSYKALIVWLIKYDPSLGEDNAHLVLSQKLLREYIATAANSRSDTNIVVIVDKLTREGRCFRISNQQIKNFKRRHFKKRTVRQLRCNCEDRDHIPAVLLSHRKYALSIDQAFVHDINNFPGFCGACRNSSGGSTLPHMTKETSCLGDLAPYTFLTVIGNPRNDSRVMTCRCNGRGLQELDIVQASIEVSLKNG